MKFTNAEYTLGAPYREKLIQKVEAFKAESRTGNVVQIVLVAAAGFRWNSNADIVTHVVDGDDLFA